MFERIKTWFKNLRIRIRHFFLGDRALERQPLLQPEPVAEQQVVLPAAQPVRQETLSPFRFLSNDVRHCLSDYIPPRDLASLVLANNQTHTLFQPIFNIKAAAILLFHVVRGNKAAPERMLTANPSLVLIRANAMDCAGNRIKNATAYEAALGAGDDDMAAMIAKSFAKIEHGEKYRLYQYEKYQPHIDRMVEMVKAFDMDSDRPAAGIDYDFEGLVEIFIASKNEDVAQALALNFAHESKLSNALEAMRIHLTPREINVADGMHFNYANLLEAYRVYVRHNERLRVTGHEFNKCKLFLRQVIGYIQRGLPACDRQAYATSIYDIVVDKKPLKREFKFTYGDGDFPVTATDDSRRGVGFERAVAVLVSLLALRHTLYKIYVEQKLQTCKTYAATTGRVFSWVRNLLK